MYENVILAKSKKFAVRIVKLRKYLYEECNERILSGQICRSGTSIGANVREANRAQSSADFVSKMQIALKEADETSYWLEVLYESGYLKEKMYFSFHEDCNELIKLLVSIINAKKNNMKTT